MLKGLYKFATSFSDMGLTISPTTRSFQQIISPNTKNTTSWFLLHKKDISIVHPEATHVYPTLATNTQLSSFHFYYYDIVVIATL